MRLENVLALTQGSLTNDPFITSFDGVTFDAKKVKRGNLFIAYDPSSIKEAVFNGAYGIVFDKPTQISDSEIAWIKVDSVENALLRLLRFHLLNKEFDVYRCDPVTLKLAQQIMTPYNFLALSGSVQELFKELWQCDDKKTILFSSELTESTLFATFSQLPRSEVGHIEIIEQTLFETSFIYDNVFYERQSLSPFFTPYLEQLLNFLKTKNIDFRLRPFEPIDHFQPIFTNTAFKACDFGTSERVLIFEPSLSLIPAQIDFLEKEALWAKTIYLLPDFVKVDVEHLPYIYFYADTDEIFDILKTGDFHFALIAGVDKSILDSTTLEEPQQLTLDF